MKHFRHTPAFTMLELVFVIAVVGIISALALPRFDRDNLQEAADQLASHIRYTQHLAMQDDRFMDPNLANPADWYGTRWQIRFAKTNASDTKWSYTIYSDRSGINAPDGAPNKSEMAINPLDSSKVLTGGYSAGTVKYNDDEASRELNLGNKYGIEDLVIDPASGCFVNNTVGNRALFFDYLGRPMYNHAYLLDDVYEDGGVNRLVLTQCRIWLCLDDPCPAGASDRKITIAIEPETGYTHIL